MVSAMVLGRYLVRLEVPLSETECGSFVRVSARGLAMLIEASSRRQKLFYARKPLIAYHCTVHHNFHDHLIEMIIVHN